MTVIAIFLCLAIYTPLGLSAPPNTTILPAPWPEPNHRFAIPLDFEASDQIRSVQFLKGEEGRNHLYFLTETSNLIYHYLLQGEEVRLLNKIELETAGPNRVAGGAAGMFIEHPGMIWLLGRGAIWYKLNEKGEVVEKQQYDLFLDEDKINDFPFFYASVPAYQINDKLVCSTNGSPDFEVEKVGIVFDLKKQSFDGVLDKENYFKGWYGDYNAHSFAFFCADDQRDEIYAGLPYSSDVFVFNEDLRLLRKEEVALSLIEKIKPIAASKVRMDPIAQERHAARQGFYYELLFDPFQNRLYRRAFAPVREVQAVKDVFKKPYLLVYNSGNFKKMGEFPIPEKYNQFKIFTSDQGLCFLNQNLYEQNENKLVFDCFEF